MKQWVGNAHGDQAVRCLQEKRAGRFDFRGASSPQNHDCMAYHMSADQPWTPLLMPKSANSHFAPGQGNDRITLFGTGF